MDGTCPVQEAFQIQFYPTMILLDRQGRILWREQGATDVDPGPDGPVHRQEPEPARHPTATTRRPAQIARGGN